VTSVPWQRHGGRSESAVVTASAGAGQNRGYGIGGIRAHFGSVVLDLDAMVLALAADAKLREQLCAEYGLPKPASGDDYDPDPVSRKVDDGSYRPRTSSASFPDRRVGRTRSRSSPGHAARAPATSTRSYETSSPRSRRRVPQPPPGAPVPYCGVTVT
jgi:hypothetical protein